MWGRRGKHSSEPLYRLLYVVAESCWALNENSVDCFNEEQIEYLARRLARQMTLGLGKQVFMEPDRQEIKVFPSLSLARKAMNEDTLNAIFVIAVPSEALQKNRDSIFEILKQYLAPSNIKEVHYQLEKKNFKEAVLQNKNFSPNFPTIAEVSSGKILEMS
jgi:phage gp16-like protein